MNKINFDNKAILTIDGYWWARSRFAIVSYESGGKTTFQDATYAADAAKFKAKLTMDLCSEINNMRGFIDDVVFVSDYKSWRKTYSYIQAPWVLAVDHIDKAYKSNRTYDSEVNWMNLYKAFYEWLDALDLHTGMQYLKVYGAEGDDLISELSMLYNSGGRNVIVLSSDADLTQTSRSNDNGTYTMYIKKKRVKLPTGFVTQNVLVTDTVIKPQLDATTEVSIFDYGGAEGSVKAAILAHVHDTETHYIPAYLFFKFILGDGGDAVQPIMWRATAKKTFRPTFDMLCRALDSYRPGMTGADITMADLDKIGFVKHIAISIHKELHKTNAEPADSWLKYYVDKYEENRTLMHLANERLPFIVQRAIEVAVDAKRQALITKTDLSRFANYKDLLEVACGIVETTAFFAMHADEIAKGNPAPTTPATQQ